MSIAANALLELAQVAEYADDGWAKGNRVQVQSKYFTPLGSVVFHLRWFAHTTSLHGGSDLGRLRATTHDDHGPVEPDEA